MITRTLHVFRDFAGTGYGLEHLKPLYLASSAATQETAVMSTIVDEGLCCTHLTLAYLIQSQSSSFHTLDFPLRTLSVTGKKLF